jgi:hypothetical protein
MTASGRYRLACTALDIDPVPDFGGPLTVEIICSKPDYDAYQTQLSRVAAQVEAAVGLPHGVLWFGYADGSCYLSRGNMATPTVVAQGASAVEALTTVLEAAALEAAARRRHGVVGARLEPAMDWRTADEFRVG